MSYIFITCIMHCCTQVQNPTPEWTDHDQRAMISAQEHCRNENECLVKFKKVEEGLYTAICGQPNN